MDRHGRRQPAGGADGPARHERLLRDREARWRAPARLPAGGCARAVYGLARLHRAGSPTRTADKKLVVATHHAPSKEGTAPVATDAQDRPRLLHRPHRLHRGAPQHRRMAPRAHPRPDRIRDRPMPRAVERARLLPGASRPPPSSTPTVGSRSDCDASPPAGRGRAWGRNRRTRRVCGDDRNPSPLRRGEGTGSEGRRALPLASLRAGERQRDPAELDLAVLRLGGRGGGLARCRLRRLGVGGSRRRRGGGAGVAAGGG